MKAKFAKVISQITRERMIFHAIQSGPDLMCDFLI